MIRLIWISVSFWMLLAVSGCKEKTAAVDPQLSDALEVQDKAIHLGIEVDSILMARMAQGNIAQNIDQLRRWKIQVENWKTNMVAVPGVEHHDHDGHDHSHDHGTQQQTASHLTPAQVKKVQEEWLAAIVALKDSLQ